HTSSTWRGPPMNLVMNQPYYRPNAAATVVAPRQRQEENCDRAELVGAAVGGLTGGLGLGYLGMNLGVRWGLEYGAGLLGSAPAAQLFSLFAFGLPYAVLGAMAVGTAGIAVGVGLGMWLGAKAGRCLSNQA
ncbi:MAG: hypothetical protein AB1758_32165, partial [Candidatus Eremiobacterota bacterium]